MDLDAVGVELYGLTPDEFIAARNQLAKTVGGTAGAAVKGLRKPTLAAWLANILVRADPAGVDALTELGEDLRTAHLSGDGVRMRSLTVKRHELVKTLVVEATALAQRQGRPATPAVVERLTETLDAAVVDPGAAQLLRSGQLTSALRHVGFGVVDETGSPAKFAPMRPRAVRSTSAKKTTKKTTTPKPVGADQELQRRRAQLQARADEIEADYREAETERAAAESLLDANQHQVQDLQATIERLTEELDHARQQLKTISRETPRLARALDRATRNAAAAQRRRDAQQKRLADLDG